MRGEVWLHRPAVGSATRFAGPRGLLPRRAMRHAHRYLEHEDATHPRDRRGRASKVPSTTSTRHTKRYTTRRQGTRHLLARPNTSDHTTPDPSSDMSAGGRGSAGGPPFSPRSPIVSEGSEDGHFGWRSFKGALHLMWRQGTILPPLDELPKVRLRLCVLASCGAPCGAQTHKKNARGAAPDRAS